LEIGTAILKRKKTKPILQEVIVEVPSPKKTKDLNFAGIIKIIS